MLSLNDEIIENKELGFFLVYDFIKCDTLENAIIKQERLLKHDFNCWNNEDNSIYFIVSKIEKVNRDGSYICSDIKKSKVN